jgi:hypothetical protein
MQTKNFRCLFLKAFCVTNGNVEYWFFLSRLLTSSIIGSHDDMARRRVNIRLFITADLCTISIGSGVLQLSFGK